MGVSKREKDRTLVVTSWVSTIGNSLLAAMKVAAGLIAGSMAVLGDGIDSATDVVISIVMLITARIISRPPSRRYPFGFDKAESVATIVLSLVIFYAGVQMLATSAGIIISGATRPLPGTLALWVTGISIVGKLALARYSFAAGRIVDSDLIIANARNMQSDVLISVGVLAGLFFTFVLKLPILDAVTSCVISLFIIRTAVGIFTGSAVVLMDGVRDDTVYRKIFEAVERVPQAHNPHRVRSRLIGGRYMIDLDIEVDGGIDICRAHGIAAEVERSIRHAIDNIYDISVHVEPMGRRHDAEPFGVDPEMMKN